MISAKVFAGNSAIWPRSTPTLEQFTRWVNDKRRLRLSGTPVELSDGTRGSLVAEVAFEAAARNSSPTATEVQAAAQVALSGLPGGAAVEPKLTSGEVLQAMALQANISRFLRVHSIEHPKFRPAFPGCGAVDAAQGDILAEGTLIEIKSVQRRFRGLDFRQALTYAAMGYASGIEIDVITLLNPRRGVFFTAQCQGLALDIGAGSWVQLMQDLVEEMSGFDVSG